MLQQFITAHDETQLNRVCYFRFPDSSLVSGVTFFRIHLRGANSFHQQSLRRERNDAIAFPGKWEYWTIFSGSSINQISLLTTAYLLTVQLQIILSLC